MHTNKTFSRVAGMLLVVLAGVTASEVLAATPPRIIRTWVGGLLTPGGSIFYRAAVNTATGGVHVLTASISSRTWRPGFPPLPVPTNGQTQNVTSATIPIPANFRGSATLTVSSFFNTRLIERKTVTFNVGPNGNGPQPTMYDVGFETLVMLNANFTNPPGMGTNRTYTWLQVSGPPVVLSSTTTTNPTFTTLPLTNAVSMETYKFGLATNYTRAFITNWTVTTTSYPVVTMLGSNNVNMTSTNWQAVTSNYNSYFSVPLARRPFPGVVGIRADDKLIRSKYAFRLTISDGVRNVIATQTVEACSPSPGLPDLPLGVKSYLQSVGSTNDLDRGTNGWTLLSFPIGSTVTGLGGATTAHPYLQPDVEGMYVLSNNLTRSTLMLTGAKYLGANNCGMCHGPNPLVAQFGMKDLFTPWSRSPHARIFERQIDGDRRPYYYERCAYCHTVGYNPATAANNGGFDDVAKTLRWAVPNLNVKDGNYNMLPNQLKALSGVQCESCHGPGSFHPGEKSLSLEVAVCGTCHHERNNRVQAEQWDNSPHAHTDYYPWFNSPANNPGCAKCHSPEAFVDHVSGKAPIRTGLGKHGCSMCHNPHSESYLNPVDGSGLEASLRIYNKVTMDDGWSVSGVGTSAICMFCHNARRSAETKSGSWPYYMAQPRGFPHEGTAANVLFGRSGMSHGTFLGTSGHMLSAGCVDCHMGPNAAVGTPERNRYGKHTFSVAYTDEAGVRHENIAACNVCHGSSKPVDKFDFIYDPDGDYDGDGTVEGVQSEVDGLMEELADLMRSSGLTDVGSYPWQGWATPQGGALNEAQHTAAWNWFLIERDLSRGIHNTQYTVALLQYSWTYLNGVAKIFTNPDTSGQTFGQHFPAAKLR